MYREVSDLSFGSISEGDDPVEASPQSEIVEGGHDTSWRTYTNNLDVEADGEDSGADDTVQDSAVSSERLPSTRGMVRFNTAFEADQDEDQQAEQNNLPASWAASEMSNLALIAAHLAAAALPPVQQSSPDQYAADAVLLPSPLTAEDMLGCGTLDLRSCTLNRRAATFAATQRLGTHASFCIPPQVFKACLQSKLHSRCAPLPTAPQHVVQVTDSNAMVARTSSVFRHGSSVGEQLQALASRTGISFSGGLRLQPSFPGINFSDLKKQAWPPLHHSLT